MDNMHSPMEPSKRAPTMPLVSVLIPAYNARQTIAESLGSAQQQTYADIEIIVVDDGSTDDTANVVSQIGAQDHRITLIRQPNAGVAVARNTALASSKGSLIAPLDSDDLWHPQKIERQVANLHHASGDVGLDYCWFVDIDMDSVVTRCYASRVEGDVYHPHLGQLHWQFERSAGQTGAARANRRLGTGHACSQRSGVRGLDALFANRRTRALRGLAGLPGRLPSVTPGDVEECATDETVIRDDDELCQDETTRYPTRAVCEIPPRFRPLHLRHV